MTKEQAAEMYILADCNNFYASCERVFAPKLRERAIVVLSNNDGCIIARSDEAKKLGLKMGQPLFQIKHLVKKHNIKVLSSNFTLYGDMSSRVMSLLEGYGFECEIYSIDEAFLHITGLDDAEILQLGYKIQQEIKQYTGIPMSIGIGATKTLAKLANYIAKKNKSRTKCVYSLACPKLRAAIFPNISVAEVWGIGGRYAKKLASYGIETVADFCDADTAWINSVFNVVVERTQLELLGTSCMLLEEDAPPKKQIIASRSFGQLQTEYSELASAVSSHVARAASKLRQQQSICQGIYVYICTNPHRKQDKQYSQGCYLNLPYPVDDTGYLLQYALCGLKQIYQQDLLYKKAGIMLSEIYPNNSQQLPILSDDIKEDRGLMTAMDKINQRFGRGVLRYAVEGWHKSWQMLRQNVTPAYTTKWSDIPIVKAK